MFSCSDDCGDLDQLLKADHTESYFQEMSDLIEEFASYEDHQSVHACVVIILSHGKDQGRIAGVDGEYITDSDVQEKFHANNCPHLAGKPKIFLFVACRGGTDILRRCRI